MKIFKSIKWRLQLWYGLILIIVLAGFGGTAYQLERNRQFRRVDEGIHQRVGAVAQILHGPGSRRQPPGGRPAQPRPDELPDFNRPPNDGQPPRDFPDDNFQGNDQPRRPLTFNLTPQLAAQFDASNPNQYWFQIFGRNGKELGRSTNVPVPEIFLQEAHILQQVNRLDNTPKIERKSPVIRAVGDQRLLADILPSGEIIWVGCSIAPELRELKITALKLSVVGSVILLFGLLGGWWFVNRALRPIAEISSTAVKISAGDLSQRVNSAEAESELGQLAAVLNSTFARLETAFAQQKQFASDAAHELRTPVSVILTQTQMALGRERDAAGYKQTVEACQRAAQRMRKLIESLLELARFDAGQEVIKRLNFDFAKTVADATELVQTLAEERGVKIISELAPLQIAGDSERLAQVVTNLLTNAIQYNQPAGEVRVKLAAANGLALLEIYNTGKSIATEDLSRVFERFYRADKSRTGAGNSGLGLSICKAIVEAHGGVMDAASVEGGTTFTVRLPNGIS
jgi:heavy metal sensor kinase